MSERERWNQRFDSPEMVLGDRPSDFLVSCAAELPRGGLALDLAAGEGRNSIFVAERGLEVVALDISERALSKLRNTASAAGAPILPAVVDLQNHPLPSVCFDAVLVFNYLNRQLAGPIARSLKPGGVLIYETLTIDYLRWNPDFNPKYLLKRGELSRMFPTLRLIKYRESDVAAGKHRRSVASLLARKE
jgi:SAM-dependent methyltransferase